MLQQRHLLLQLYDFDLELLLPVVAAQLGDLDEQPFEPRVQSRILLSSSTAT